MYFCRQALPRKECSSAYSADSNHHHQYKGDFQEQKTSNDLGKIFVRFRQIARAPRLVT